MKMIPENSSGLFENGDFVNIYKPKVSIVIPVYNGANYLSEAIDSALTQTYKNIEVIVVNDGSDDGWKTEEIAKSYFGRVTYYYKPNGGVSSALNLGINNMTGDFFSWLSHDDIYYPDKIDKQLNYFLQHGYSKHIIYSHNEIISSDGSILKAGSSYEIDQSKLNYNILAKRFISGCTLLIPKQAFAEVGLFSDRYYTVQDFEMWFRLISNGYIFKYLPITAVKTRLHNMQDSRVKTELFNSERNRFFIEVQQWLNNDLWINSWDNKALGFFVLALHYKKARLMEVYKYDLKMGKKHLKELNLKKRAVALFYYIYVLLWVRYLSPVTYYNKLFYLLKHKVGY